MKGKDMPDFLQLESLIPVAPLSLIVMDSARELGESVDQFITSFRHNNYKMPETDHALKGYVRDSYIIDFRLDRFGSGEAKATILESVRGNDVYILTDVCNYSITYKMYNYVNHKSPDDHYQDLKRVIGAITGKAKRINVIMPFLYEGRQHKRNGMESLDAAQMFKELHEMGISNFITFDAHDPRISNAKPLGLFDNFLASYQFMKALLTHFDDLIVDKDHLTVISPDEGALDRAVYFANVIGADTGMFYKRRDYAHVVNGTNPIVAHEFLGSDISGRDVIVIDDMISSGSSMIDTAKQLKNMGAKRVFICTTFGLFTDGMSKFDEGYKNDFFDAVITTNLTYMNDDILSREYVYIADMSKFLATIIDFMNHDASMATVNMPTDMIHKIVSRYNMGCKTPDELFK